MLYIPPFFVSQSGHVPAPNKFGTETRPNSDKKTGDRETIINHPDQKTPVTINLDQPRTTQTVSHLISPSLDSTLETMPQSQSTPHRV